MGELDERGFFLNIITFYADCQLSGNPEKNQAGFDWRRAIKMLEKSAAKFGYRTLVVTDEKTEIESPWLRVSNAKDDGLMMWLLKAQHAAICAADGPAVMVSPDTLIAKPLDFLAGNDLTLLTRKKPKPIINSVIAFSPSAELAALWDEVVRSAQNLPAESREWGADIDAVVQRLQIQPNENGCRNVAGVNVRFLPVDGLFQSVKRERAPHRLDAPIWDFKGARKSLMHGYARLLNAHH